jgi:hypothetical protein
MFENTLMSVDRYLRKMNAIRDDFVFEGRRAPDLAIVKRKCRDRVPFLIAYRTGPAGTQPMRKCEMLESLPADVAFDIRHDDIRFQIGRSPAGACQGANRNTVQRLGIYIREARTG